MPLGADHAELPEAVRASAELLDSLAAAPGAGDSGGLVWLQSEEYDKYDFPDVAGIDCDTRVHLCKATCCRLKFALSEQDVSEGVIAWDSENPFLIASSENGYCQHLEAGPHSCGVYSQRPVPCRAFDCREDRRIWLDFEKGVINPAVDRPDWPWSAETSEKS